MGSSLKKTNWIEVIPHGLVGGMAPGLSLVVFKEKEGEKRFAIWLSKLQSQIAIQQGIRKEETFSFLTPLLKSLNVSPKVCYFRKSGEGEPHINIHFQGEKKIQITFKASESLAFCIYHKCQFFCTYQFMESVRELRFENISRKIKRESPLSLN